MRIRRPMLSEDDDRLVRRGETQDAYDRRMSTSGPIRAVPGGFADGDGSIRGVEPTITALWAAVNVLQQDVAELQREIFQGEDGEE